MTKQTELCGLLDSLKNTVRVEWERMRAVPASLQKRTNEYARRNGINSYSDAKANGWTDEHLRINGYLEPQTPELAAAQRSVGDATRRIFSFFDQMRRTIDGLKSDIQSVRNHNIALVAERDKYKAELAKLQGASKPMQYESFDPAKVKVGDEIEVCDTFSTWRKVRFVAVTSNGSVISENIDNGTANAHQPTRARIMPQTTQLQMFANVYRTNRGVVWGHLTTDQKLGAFNMLPSESENVVVNVPVTFTVAK